MLGHFIFGSIVYNRAIVYNRQNFLNQFMPSGFFYFNSLNRFICLLNANSVDENQTPRFAASDLGLHCLLMSFLWNARIIWVKLVVSRNYH